MPSSIILGSIVFLSVAFSFSLTIFMKFIKSPYSVPVLFFSLSLAFMIVSQTFSFLEQIRLVQIFELIAYVSIFLTAFSLFRLFARSI
ncbi:MAG: hypothetical protein AABW85_03405 [archaeon]